MKDTINFIEENAIGNYEENVSFKLLTTYKTGGNASLVVYPNSIESLKKLLKYLQENNISKKIFGNGSNILASDIDYNGVIIKLTAFDKYELKNNILHIDAGCNLMVIANKFSKEGYSGLEFACGIPGTIGGAVYMNAGAYLKSMADILIKITILDDEYNIRELTNEDLKFSYRSSLLKTKPYIVLDAYLKLEKKDKEEINDLITSRQKRRYESQPLEYPSAGSVFRNPNNDYAGRLIEECNLKGYTKGGAEISAKHANFIINKDNATSSEIKYLMDKAHDDVLKKFNINLIREQELFNWK